MNIRFYKLWLADELKPKISKNYYLTSCGLASKDENNRNKTVCFLNRNMIDNDNYYFYDSSYTIYKTNIEDIDINNSNLDYDKSINDEFLYISKDEYYLSIIIYQDSLFIFENSSNYIDLLKSVCIKNNIKYIYSRFRINNLSISIHYYFKGNKIETNDTFINEFQINGLIGDKKNSRCFKSGVYEFIKDYNSNNLSMPILMFSRDNKEYNNYLISITHKQFINLVSKIDEFKFDNDYEELSDYIDFGGCYYKCEVDNKIIGIVAVARSASTFDYYECLGVFKEYRKKYFNNRLYSSYLIESIKYLSNYKKKNAILTIEHPSLLKFYINNNFKIVGKFFFD